MNSPIDHCENCTSKKGSWSCVGCRIKLPIDTEPIILNRVVERYPNIWQKKCSACEGNGYTAEHDPGDPHYGGECNSCPIQVECPSCKGEGWVYNYLTPEQYRKQTGFDWVGAVWIMRISCGKIIMIDHSIEQSEDWVITNEVILLCHGNHPYPDEYIPEAE